MKAGLYIVGILLCALVAAFLSGTETGLLSLSHARLMDLVRAGVKWRGFYTDTSEICSVVWPRCWSDTTW